MDAWQIIEKRTYFIQPSGEFIEGAERPVRRGGAIGARRREPLSSASPAWAACEEITAALNAEHPCTVGATCAEATQCAGPSCGEVCASASETAPFKFASIPVVGRALRSLRARNTGDCSLGLPFKTCALVIHSKYSSSSSSSIITKSASASSPSSCSRKLSRSYSSLSRHHTQNACRFRSPPHSQHHPRMVQERS